MEMKIGFSKLKTSCIIGIYEHEREQEQVVEADVAVTIDIPPEQDPACPLLDYTAVAELFSDHARSKRYFLLESLALGFRSALLERFPAVRSVFIEIRKPGAIPNADAAFVRLEC